MVEPGPAAVVACDLVALLFAWLVAAVAFRVLSGWSWRDSAVRGFGFALLSLALLVGLRFVFPDMFVIPLVFLLAATADVVTSMRRAKPRDRVIISALVSMFTIGALVLVDGALRLLGYRLTV